MKQLTKVVAGFAVTLSFFLALTAAAQVHTARPNVAVSSKCKGYYEYLPEGYNPSGTALYPMLIFFPGIGEFGSGSASMLTRVVKNGPPKLIEAGTFPTSFTAGGLTHRFIVITPQFTSTPITAANVDTVIQYMLTRYKVDPKRVYLTGLSYGGGLSFAYPGNRNTAYAARIAAVVPVATPLPLPVETGYDTIYARSRIIAAQNIPVWATHNSGDTPDSASRTTAYVNYINQAPAPNPLAKKTIFTASGHDAWTKTYDPNFRENGYNIYEWMLLHQKGSAPPAANAVPTANAGADKTITLPTSSISLSGTGADSDGTISTYSWTKVAGPIEGLVTSASGASTTATGLVAGVYTFRLTVGDNKSAKGTDDVKVTVNPAAGTKAIQVNIFGGSNAYSSTAWNNWSVGTTAATNKVSTAFKYVDGATSTVTATLSATSAVKDNGSTYASGIVMAPAGVLRYNTQHNAARTLTLQGLSPTKTYNLELYASYNSTTSSNNTIFVVNGVSVSINVNSNFTKKAAFTNLAPNASGQITISIDKTGSYNYLNGFTLSESSTATTTLKFVKINLFGGTNAYASTEWNNWNVGTTAATNKSIGALKYSDGTASAIGALLSATSAVVDNGATYGSGMAPAEVLRYTTSYTGGARTLTLSGLAVSKKYDLEFYASRSSSATSNNTSFAINGIVASVGVNYNLTNKALFTDVTPNSSGQIIVTIDKTSSYSYFNGFTITEKTSSTTAIKQGSVTLQRTPVAEEAATAAVSLYPNPAGSAAVLRVTNNYQGAVLVQISDAGGRLLKTFRFTKGTSTLQQSLPLQNLSSGLYYVTLQQGGTRTTLPFSKL